MRRPALLIAAAALAAVLGSFAFAGSAAAATNIVENPTSSRWGWNDVIGWIDFYVTGTVTVGTDGITGYATSSNGAVSLDCATSPGGDICGTSDYQVLNDGAGNLSGWAWNDVIGWISFCGGQSSANCPGSTSYRVLVDGGTGDFSGWAWNDAVGWISFNCLDIGGQSFCDNTSNFKLDTTWTSTSTLGWVESSTFDTGISGGAQINSVLWHGSMPSPTNGSFVGFQFAVSAASSGPWSYQGPDGSTATYYTASPGVSEAVDYVLHNNARYFRYKMFLSSTLDQNYSPRVDSVGVNWSR